MNVSRSRGALSDEEVESLCKLEEDGVLAPLAIVAAARDPTHPLHDRFMWDDSSAADAWRQHQARELIHLVYVTISTTTRTVLAPLYVHDPTSGGQQCYRNTVFLAEHDQDRARAVLQYTIKIARGHLSRAETLADALNLRAEVHGAVGAIDAILGKLEQEALRSDA